MVIFSRKKNWNVKRKVFYDLNVSPTCSQRISCSLNYTNCFTDPSNIPLHVFHLKFPSDSMVRWNSNGEPSHAFYFQLASSTRKRNQIPVTYASNSQTFMPVMCSLAHQTRRPRCSIAFYVCSISLYQIHVFHRNVYLRLPIIIDLRLIHRSNVKFTRDSPRALCDDRKNETKILSEKEKKRKLVCVSCFSFRVND